MSLKSKFCAKCGKETKLMDGFCEDCYFDTHPIKIPKSKELRICSKCGASLITRFWVTHNKLNPAVLAEQVKQAIKTPDQVKVIRVDLDKVKFGSFMEVTFELKGRIFSKKYPINLAIAKQLCPPCKANTGKTNRCKIQLRTRANTPTFIQEMYEYFARYSKFVVEIKELRTGIDIFVTSRSIGLKIARATKQKFNMRMKETRKEYSWDRTRNKPKYQSTIRLNKR
jgi:NMD protein affecting ribosome stability and mRNA decay